MIYILNNDMVYYTAEVLSAHIDFLQKEIKKMESPIYALTQFPGSEAEQKKKLSDLYKELREYQIKAAEYLDTKDKKEYIEKLEQEKTFLEGNTFVNLDPVFQSIQVGERKLYNFNNLFELLRIKEKESVAKSQKKGGIALLYAIARYKEEKPDKENMLIIELLAYIKEFRKNRTSWEWGKNGVAKKSISKTDCDTAMCVLGKCNIKRSIKLVKEKDEIMITE